MDIIEMEYLVYILNYNNELNYKSAWRWMQMK